MANKKEEQFLHDLWEFYNFSRRDLAWRKPEKNGSFDPYKIWVSEVMLQQTQVHRVEKFYPRLLQKYPDVLSLSMASLSDLLAAWKGLGYNRRAGYLRVAAQIVMKQHGGNFPKTLEELVRLPGIGKNTAGAILAYAYNLPALFIETNIRTVFIHHFFTEQTEHITDKQILDLLSDNIDRENPREFYWALMDYGTYLKQIYKGLNRRSASYKRQSSFQGSLRQLRAQVLFAISERPLEYSELKAAYPDLRLDTVLEALQNDNLISQKDGRYIIGD